MRKPTRRRLVSYDPVLENMNQDRTAALLGRIHALAQKIDMSGGADRDTVAFLAEHLKAGEVCLARHAHRLLLASVVNGLENCGCVDMEDADLLRALKDFACEEGWEFEDGDWRRSRAPMAAEVAHA